MPVPAILALILTIFCGVPHARAAETAARSLRVFERMGSEQGLSVGRINCIIQDRRGFMWFGSDDGLNKYDGHNFHIFKHDVYDERSLPDNTVRMMVEDTRSRLWIVTNDGSVSMREAGKEHFHRCRMEGMLRSAAPKATISAMCARSDGSVWLGTSLGQIFVCPAGEREFHFQQTISPQHSKAVSIYVLFEDKEDRLWLGSQFGVYEWSKARGTFSLRSTRSKAEKAPLVRALFLDQRGELWAAGNELWLYDRKSQCFEVNTPPTLKDAFAGSNAVRSICQDHRGYMWMGGLAGLIRFESQSGEGILLGDDLRRPNFTNRLRVYALYRDRSDNIWVASSRNGLIKIPLFSSVFHHHGAAPDSPLDNNRIRALMEDREGRLWVGAETGLFFAPSLDEVRLERLDGLQPRDSPLAPVNALTQDSSGRIWIGYSARDVVIYDPASGHIDHVRRDSGPGKLQGFVYSMLTDKDGDVWLGSNDGLVWHQADSARFRTFPIPHLADNFAGKSVIFDILEDQEGTIWVGGMDGLLKFDRASAVFTRHYSNYIQDSGSISARVVLDIYEDPLGSLWIGTNGGGFNRLDRASGRFRHFTVRDGLANNTVYGIQGDTQGHLWMSTNGGLCRYDTLRKIFRTFGAREGLQDNEFFFGAHSHGRDGELLFGGVNGFNIFHPDSVPVNRHLPPIVISRFKALDSILHNELQNGDHLTLSYDQNSFSFEFAALDYCNPERNQYAYMLEGIDSDWINSGGRRYAAYTKLPPDRYTLRVKGSNDDNQWNEEGLTVTIDLRPPFWQTLLFRSAALTAIGALIVLLVRLRIRSVQRREASRRQQLEAELQALRLQLNPHFIFNSLTSIQHMLLARDPEGASDVLAQFAHLIRSLLEHSRREQVSLAEELNIIEYYLRLQALRFNGDLHWDIRLAHDIDSRRLAVPPLLFQPFVENSIMHGLAYKKGRRQIVIDISRRKGTLFCSIEDNGIGRERASQHKRPVRSTGTQATRERLSLLSEQKRQHFSMRVVDLYTKFGDPDGTRVEIALAESYLLSSELRSA